MRLGGAHAVSADTPEARAAAEAVLMAPPRADGARAPGATRDG